MAETVPLLEMRQVTKTFPGVRALHNVSLSVKSGEIHALTGENGAGKSTLMKILSGAYAADSGAILMQGQPVKISSPNDARNYGIKIIYQELSLAANMTVAENIFLGMELAQASVLVNRARMNKETLKVLERLGASFGPGDVVGSLSIAEQQQVEIARAIIHDSKVLIMDEPTATLSEWETERLFQIIRVLRDDGIAIIYISHRMAEIYELADRVSVLRDGEYIGTLERSNLSAPRLIQMMVGRELKDFYKHERTTRAGDVVLEIQDMSDGDRVRDVSFTVRSGEVLGLAGLVGAGRTELARLIFGADSKIKGAVILEGRPVAINRPTDAIRAGIGYLPENRKEQGLFLQMSAQENIAINVMPQNSVAGVIRRRSIARIVAEAIRNLAIRLASPRSLALGLSGGNQQKLLVARWLAISPKVLLLDEPTRGVDVGAKSEIYRIIGDLVAQGVGVVFISSELPEVVGMCDRVLVMRQGQIVAELGTPGHEAITQENIVAYATGTKKAEL